MDNRPVQPGRHYTSWTGARNPDFSGLYDRPTPQGPIQQHVLRCPACRREEPCDRLLELVSQAKRFGDTVSMSYFNEVPVASVTIKQKDDGKHEAQPPLDRRLFGWSCWLCGKYTWNRIHKVR